MSAQANDASFNTASGSFDAIPCVLHAAQRDEADDWLGYESVHPLTWIPAPSLAPASAE